MKHFYTIVIVFCLIPAYSFSIEAQDASNQSAAFEKVKAYPNPINKGGTFTVEIPENIKGELTISLYNTVGKIIYTTKTGEKKVEMTAPLTTGIYLIRFVERQKVITVEKIVVTE